MAQPGSPSPATPPARLRPSAGRAPTASAPDRPAGLYRPMEHLVVRAPLRPVDPSPTLPVRDGRHPPNPMPGPPVGERIPRAGSGAGDGPQPRRDQLVPAAGLSLGASLDPGVRLAVAVASPSLLAALDRVLPGDPGAARVEGKLLRYLIRMSTRPTPFGLFAGVGVARWAERTDLAVAGPARTRTRLDMAWLLGLVLGLEADAGLRRHLRLVANTAAFERGGRIHLSERAPAATAVPAGSVSVRATGAARRALALARRPIPYADLAADLLATVPGATPDRVDRLLAQLCDTTLLLTDLRPPLTDDNPAGWVVDRLSAAATDPTGDDTAPGGEARGLAREQAVRLADLVAEAAALDRVGPEQAAHGHDRIAERVGPAGRDGARALLQVDAGLALGGRGVHAAVGEVVAEAAELLLRMTPMPDGPGHLAAYRRAFLRRYGPDRRVPLLELVDPRFGLGPLGAATGPAGSAGAGRNQLLLDLAARALRERRMVVELDSELVGRLATWTPDPGTAPASLELYVGVAAESAGAIDRGDFTVVVGHGPGVSPAGRNLGRFADLLGPGDRAAVAAGDRAAWPARDGVVVAELVYLPSRLRQANVAVRPGRHRHELVVGTSPGVPADRLVPLDELVVGVGDGRLRLWWPAGGVEVEVAAGHMLVPTEAPAVARFLAEVGRDGRPQLGGFSWGPAGGLPFLPRVQAGRVVLRPASWRAGPDAATPAGSRRWREGWGVPRHVRLGGGDRRLLLDLDDPAQAGQVLDELGRGRPVVLHEALAGPGAAWLHGPGGRYLCELVVPLVLAEQPPAATGRSRPAAVTSPADDRRARLRPPGSDWLYLKLYGPREDEDELVAGPVRELAEAAVRDRLAEAWFFVRYADPDPHLRLRFRGEPAGLGGELLGRLSDWAGGLVAAGACERFAVDTYERELERYGGPDGMAAAEDLFAADSRCVAALLGPAGPGPELDRVALAVLTTDDLLAALGLDPARRLGWYGRRVTDRRASGEEHRRRKTTLRLLLAGAERLRSSPDRHAVLQPAGRAAGVALLDLLAGRRAAVVPVAGRLAGLAAAGRLGGRTAEDLAASFVHLHCNRLLGPDPATERLVLGLLLRTLESLDRAPLPRPG